MKSEYKLKIFGYECDIYGHLNDANYLHIFEEARSKGLEDLGLSVSELFRLNIHIYITDIHLQYKRGIPLEETIIVVTEISHATRLKSIWHQEVFDHEGNLCSIADVTGVFVRGGKPMRLPKEIMEIFGVSEM